MYAEFDLLPMVFIKLVYFIALLHENPNQFNQETIQMNKIHTFITGTTL